MKHPRAIKRTSVLIPLAIAVSMFLSMAERAWSLPVVSRPAPVEERISQGKEALRRNELIKALKIFKRLEKDSSAANAFDEIYFYISKIYGKLGKAAQARTYASWVKDKYTGSQYYCPAAQQYCTALIDEKEEYKACLEDLVRSCGEPEFVITTYQQLSSMYYERKEYARCIDAIDRLFVYTQSLSQKKQSFVPLSEDVLYFWRAQSQYHLGVFAEALSDYTKALARAKDDSLKDRIYAGMGWAQSKMSLWEEAKQSFSQIQKDADRRYAEATLLLFEKDHAAALNAYQSVRQSVREGPLLCKALVGEAECLYELNRYKDANSAYQKALRLCSDSDPESYEKALYGIGWCFIKEGDFNAAMEFFGRKSEKYNQTAAGQVALRLSLAQAHRSKGDAAKALEVFRQLLDQFPYSSYAAYIHFQIGLCLLDMDRVKEALLEFAALKKQYPQSSYSADYLFYIGSHYYDRGDTQAAEEYLAAFGNTRTADPLLRGRADRMAVEALFNQKKYSAVIEYAARLSRQESVSKDPLLMAWITYIRSLALKEAGRIEEAFPLWKQLTGSPLPIQLRSEVFTHIGDYFFERKKDMAQALFYYTKLVNEYPYNPLRFAVRLKIARCLIQQRRNPEAAQVLQQIAAEATDAVILKDALLLQARLYEFDKTYDAADQVYARLIERFPEDAGFAWFKRGFFAYQRQEYTSAVHYWEEARNNRFVSAEMNYYSGVSAESAGDDGKAESDYKIVIAQYRESDYAGPAFVRLGRLYERLGKREDALAMYTSAAMLDIEEAAFARQKAAELKSELAAAVHK